MTRETTVLPARNTDLLDAAEQLLASTGEVSLEAQGHSVPIPPELRQLLADVVKTMRRGQAIVLAPLGQQLTTQQAADMLGISRPTLIKLLEDGRIPYETPGRHRRLRLADVLNFQQLRRIQQQDALQELAVGSQAAGLYDAPPEAFDAALRSARKKHA